MENNLPELMSVKELMKYFSCSKDKAYSMIKSKTFPSMQIGSRWYIVKNRLPEWIEKQTKKSTYSN